MPATTTFNFFSVEKQKKTNTQIELEKYTKFEVMSSARCVLTVRRICASEFLQLCVRAEMC